MKLCLLVVCLAVLLHSAAGVPLLKNGRLYVNGESLVLKGVGYEPAPIGVDVTTTPPYGDYFTKNYATGYNRDLNILRPLGVNLLRLWGWGNAADHSDFLNMAYNGGTDPIYVAAEFWIGPSSYPNLADPSVVAKVLADFGVFLKAANSHHDIMFYILGSDLNASWNYGGELDALFAVLNQLATAAHAYNSSFLVTTALNDVNSQGIIGVYDADTELDFWSINVYRGCSFTNLFSTWTQYTSKALFISEYGIDSYNDVQFAEDDTMQSNCVIQLSKQILLNNATTIGGALVEYVDEYWKGKLGATDARHPACPDYNPNHHSNCGQVNTAFPDQYVNQAWFGIVNATFAPRSVAAALKTLWA